MVIRLSVCGGTATDMGSIGGGTDKGRVVW